MIPLYWVLFAPLLGMVFLSVFGHRRKAGKTNVLICVFTFAASLLLAVSVFINF